MVKTYYLPGFSHLLHGRRPQREAEKIRKQAEELHGLAGMLRRFIPRRVFARAAGQRDRDFGAWVTFVAFLGQVLTRGSSTREAVRGVQAWCAAAKRRIPSSNTSAYCQARVRLAMEKLWEAHERLGEWIDKRNREAWSWCGRSVKVLDGTGVSMPDTAENRKRWPYASGQRPGCGFPTAHLVGLFCLATGRLVRFATDSWKAHELPMARQLIGWVQPGEIVLGDRGFCGWGLIALFVRKEVDVVMRLHQARKKGRCGRQVWKKPQRPTRAWGKTLWRELPAQVEMRIVHFRIEVPGFRTQEVTLATTLLDEEAYPDEAIAQLYARRWSVELFFRDIKTTLGLDVLRCLTPELVEKETWMHAIAYNLVRALMLEAAWTHGVELDRLSFKGTVDTIRQWAPLFAQPGRRANQNLQELLRIIASDTVPLRPHRSEPRARKRRPKPYQKLTKPRHQMVVSPSRNQK